MQRCEGESKPIIYTHSTTTTTRIQQQQKPELDRVFKKHEGMMTDLPGDTNFGENVVHLVENKVVSVQPYPLPLNAGKVVEGVTKSDLG